MNDPELVLDAAAEPAPAPAPIPTAERPSFIPEKFWDPELATVRLEALAKSYVELERKLGERRSAPAADATAPTPGAAPTAADNGPTEAPSTPAAEAAPAGYSIEARHPLLTQDPALDARLQAAGFTQPQAQLVYDLAAERLLPMLDEMLGEVAARRDVERLERRFGGPEAWQATARQLKSWAAAHLTAEVSAALSSSFEGVLALHQMMRASEPELLGTGDEPPAEVTADTLTEMMRDPRYWRQRDPDFVARVTAGFKKLYGS